MDDTPKTRTETVDNTQHKHSATSDSHPATHKDTCNQPFRFSETYKWTRADKEKAVTEPTPLSSLPVSHLENTGLVVKRRIPGQKIELSMEQPRMGVRQ